MENNREMTELLEKIEANGRKQLWTGRILCLLLLTCAGSCIYLVVKVTGILPQVGDVMTQLEGVLENLKTATTQLAQLDLAGMVADVDGLVTSAQQAMEQIGGIDFQQLNKAIEDLSAVIEPLAKWAKIF